jgi:hypothetical protein
MAMRSSSFVKSLPNPTSIIIPRLTLIITSEVSKFDVAETDSLLIACHIRNRTN